MSDLTLSILLIFVLFFIGGLFAAAEMALVTLRESQVQQLRTKGKRGRALVQLLENPNKFLSSVQIGVTLAGFLSSAFGSDSLTGTDQRPYVSAQAVPSGGFQPWQQFNGLFTRGPVDAINADGRQELYGIGTDGGMYRASQPVPNGGWSGFTSLGGWLVAS